MAGKSLHRAGPGGWALQSRGTGGQGTRFMRYADDTIWLLFGMGLAMIGGVFLFYFAFGEFGWASVGFLITGVLVMWSYFLVGSHPPQSANAGSSPDGSSGQPARAVSEGGDASHE